MHVLLHLPSSPAVVAFCALQAYAKEKEKAAGGTQEKLGTVIGIDLGALVLLLLRRAF